jgi:hypothetical protein
VERAGKATVCAVEVASRELENALNAGATWVVHYTTEGTNKVFHGLHRAKQGAQRLFSRRVTSMKKHVRLLIATSAAALACVIAAPEAAAQSDNRELARLLAGIANSLQAEQDDVAIRRAFNDVLRRDPNDREMRRYRTLMHENHWTEQDVRDDLGGRDDHRRHSQQSSADVERIIRRAYDDILHRDPDAQGMRTYRTRMIDEGWTEAQVREALRNSPEHGQRAVESADKIVRRAYQDVLKRDPDQAGVFTYRNKVLHDGWDEHDVREALKRSPEYREQNAMTRDKAEQIVRRAYLSVLGREPDSGSRGYVDRVLRDHWNEQEIGRELRNSDEYRNKHKR